MRKYMFIYTHVRISACVVMRYIYIYYIILYIHGCCNQIHVYSKLQEDTKLWNKLAPVFPGGHIDDNVPSFCWGLLDPKS